MSRIAQQTLRAAETRAIGEAAKDANMVVSIGVNERDGGSIHPR